MILSQAIKELFPGVDFENDVVLRDDGDGVVYIAIWALPVPRPSETELAGAWLSVLAKKAIAEADRVAREKVNDDAKDLHELMKLKETDWTLEEIRQIVSGILERLDFLDFLELE